MSIPAAHSGNADKHAKHQYIHDEILKSLDLVQFGLTMNELVQQGMNEQMAVIFQAQFDCLLASVQSENNRINSWGE